MILNMRQKTGDTIAQTAMAVLVDGDDYEELTNLGTRNKVLAFARSIGFPARGLNGVPTPYPVGENDETDEGLLDGSKPIKCWQAEYVLQAAA